ncbi:hypothetical protein ACJX0J_028188 [Zea mays]
MITFEYIHTCLLYAYELLINIYYESTDFERALFIHLVEDQVAIFLHVQILQGSIIAIDGTPISSIDLHNVNFTLWMLSSVSSTIGFFVMGMMNISGFMLRTFFELNFFVISTMTTMLLLLSYDITATSTFL